MAAQVQVLREFRDTYLLTHAVGRQLVAWYYWVSPPLAAIISESTTLRVAVRTALTPVVWTASIVLHGTRAQQLVLVLGVLLGGAGMWWGAHKLYCLSHRQRCAMRMP